MHGVLTTLEKWCRTAWSRVARAAHDERGEITSETILTALKVGLAVVVGTTLTVVIGAWLDVLPKP